MRNTETTQDGVKPDEGASAASNHGFEQSTVLQGIAREWRENVADIRRTLFSRGQESPAANWTDVRHAVSPLDSVVEDSTGRGRLGRVIENGKWLLLTVIPVAALSLFGLRSKKFRD